MTLTTTDGLHVERLGHDYLVVRPGHTDALHLVGDHAEAFALALRSAHNVPERLTTPMAGLIELGIVTADSDVWSRRRVLQLGGAAAAAGVAVIALPSVPRRRPDQARPHCRPRHPT